MEDSDTPKLTRRQTLAMTAAGALALSTGMAKATPDNAISGQPGAPAPDWLIALAQSETGGRDYVPQVEGDLPKALHGALYRNGPGLYERNGVRKNHLLDGDGLVQRLAFDRGRVHYRNEFVQTKKFQEEEAAGRYQYSTWTTRRPGGPLANLGGGPMASQAGITVYPVGDKVYALDEGNPVYELEPETLATLGSRALGGSLDNIKAHTKFDPVTGEWLLAGQGFGRTGSLDAVVYDRFGKLTQQHHVADTPMVYFHDFLVTEHYFVFVLHPCELQPLGFLLGMRSVIDSLRWRPERGNTVVLLPRTGGQPQYFEAPAAFMWHALNAYERGDEVIADIVAYDRPDHFIGEPEPMLKALMDGKVGAAEEPGKIRRYRMNTRNGQLREEILHAGNHEFPFVDPRVASREHRVGYFAYSGLGALQTGLKRMDMNTGAEQVYDFGPGTHVGEPVFVPRPEGGIDEGWLVSQCLDGASRRTFFALFDAQAVDEGPRAKIWLAHSVPLSFHGWWRSDA